MYKLQKHTFKEIASHEEKKHAVGNLYMVSQSSHSFYPWRKYRCKDSSIVYEETDMEKYISTYTYFRQQEQCVPSTSFFEAKMNKSHKNDISEN